MSPGTNDITATSSIADIHARCNKSGAAAASRRDTAQAITAKQVRNSETTKPPGARRIHTAREYLFPAEGSNAVANLAAVRFLMVAGIKVDIPVSPKR